MNSDQHWYRDPARLREEVEKHGGITAAALANDTAPGTVQKWASRNGVKAPVTPINTTPPAMPRQPDDPIPPEDLLRARVKELETVVRQYENQAYIDEKILEEVRKHVTPIIPKYHPAPREKSSKRTAHTHLLQWSDLHACEVVDFEQMNGLNSYDWDVMLARHERMRHAMLSFKDNRPYPVEELVIAGIGDMLTGDIHDELRITNEKTLTEGTFQLAHDMGDWIETLVPEYPRIRIRCTFGNHGRLSKKPSFKDAFHNWDWLFYKTLQLRLSRYESIDFQVSKAAQVPVEIYNKRILLWHGDGIRSTMVDVPWGGIMRYCKKLSDTWREMKRPIDHFVIGHWHEANQIRAGWILMNGSVKGADEYSFARFGGGQAAQQVLATFHPVRGLTETCLLNLQ